MLSGLNNLEKYSIQSSKFSQYYGINQEELDLLLVHFNIKDNKRDKIKDWYNGYQEKVSGKNEFVSKYNIWSIVQYLRKQDDGFKSYWMNSGSMDFITQLLTKEPVKEAMESLVDGESIAFALKSDFSVEDFKQLKVISNIGNNVDISPYGLEIFLSYLFITGYLTEAGHGRYKLPNKEVKYEIGKRISESYKLKYTLDTGKLQDLTNILQNIFDNIQKFDNDKKVGFITETFISQFQPKFEELIYRCRLVNETNATEGIFANEDEFHPILNYVGIQVVNYIGFSSEVYTDKLYSNGKGRVDFSMKDYKTGLIIEVKYKGNAYDALAQAKSYEKLINNQQNKIFIGFDISKSKKVSLAGEINIEGKDYCFNL
jgi:hypothetical protein